MFFKKFLMVVLAGMAMTMGLSAQATTKTQTQPVSDWANDIAADQSNLLYKQVVEDNKVLNEKTGVWEQKPAFFRITYVLRTSKVVFDEATKNSIQYVSRQILADSVKSFTVLTKDGSGKEALLKEQAFLSITPVSIASEKDSTYLRLVLRVPTNYIRVSFAFKGLFETLFKGETEERVLVDAWGSDPKQFAQPASVAASAPQEQQQTPQGVLSGNQPTNTPPVLLPVTGSTPATGSR